MLGWHSALLFILERKKMHESVFCLFNPFCGNADGDDGRQIIWEAKKAEFFLAATLVRGVVLYGIMVNLWLSWVGLVNLLTLRRVKLTILHSLLIDIHWIFQSKIGRLCPSTGFRCAHKTPAKKKKPGF